MQKTGIYCTNGFLRGSLHHTNFAFIMKTSLIVLAGLFFSINLMVASPGYSQGNENKVVRLKYSNVALSEVFKSIEAQANVVFSYEFNKIESKGKVTINKENITVANALDLLLKDKGLSWQIRENVITIRQLKNPETTNQAGDITSPAISPLFTAAPIKGIVRDADGKPLAGATITVKGTSRTTLSDPQGAFALDVQPGDILIISFVGLQTTELRIESGRSNYAVELLPAKKTESEVIVSTGYQILPRERAAGSFGLVDQKTLEKRNNFNILSYLEGQVPGLLMSSAGEITIRGKSTIAANEEPLIVVDGFPIERSVETINANDIESITVLKDASAASIWGVRAANGVIVIQTKRGQSSRKPLDISFSTALSITPVSDFSALPFAGSQSFLELEKFRVDNNLVFFTGTKPRQAISPVIDAYLNNPSQANGLVDDLKNNNSYNEFQHLFMDPATRQQYALSLAGRGDRSTYRASFSYDKRLEQFKKNTSDRFTADLFQTSSITKALTIELGLNWTMTNNRNNGMSLVDLNTLLPYQRISDENGSYINQPQTFYQADKEELVNAGFPYNWNYNLLQEFNNKDNKDVQTTINAVAGLSYQFFKGVSANVRYQYEQGNYNTTNLYNEETYFVRNLINYSTYRNNSGVITTGLPYYGSILRENSGKLYSHTLRGQLRADRNLGSTDHYISAIAGGEIREVGNSSSSQTKYGYDPQSLQFARVSYTTPYTNVRGTTNQLLPDESAFRDVKDRFVSVYGNAGYTYLDRYTLNGSARLDQTNLFGSSKKYRNVWLWSMGASWQLHKENFFHSTLFNSLILRATYGINGNVDRNTSPFLIASVGTSPTVNRPFASIINPQNPLLRWEKTDVTNVGIDFSMLHNRLKGSLEYYTRYSHDLLGSATVNGTYGFNTAFINYASMRNTGVDVKLSANIFNGAFKWNATLNYSYNKNEVKEVDFPQKTVGAFLGGQPQAGKPLEYVYSYAWAGLSATGAPQVMDVNKEAVDYTTDIADPAALIYQGTLVPPHYGALINEFGFKRFSVLTNFTFKLGHKFRIPVIHYQSISESSYNVFKDWDNRWREPGDEAITNIPAAPTSINGLNVYDKYSEYADINVATASHVRFRELLINYTLPENILGAKIASAIMVGVQIRNLATYKFNDGDLDPEYLTNYRGSIVLPLRPEYSFILKANF